MSSAAVVPETYELRGDDAMDTVARVRLRRLIADSITRLRAADGLSHARATAFQVVLTLIPGAIVLVAAASFFRWESLTNALDATIEFIAPGASGEVFREAMQQGAENGGNRAALLGGLAALIVSGTTAFGQVERTANRIYGIESDRPALKKYAVAFSVLVTAGVMLALYFLVIGVGGGWQFDESIWGTIWQIARWPLAALFLTAAVCVVFKVAPRRRQPAMSWLALGAALAVGASIISSLLLNLYLSRSDSFGETYGPLASFLGVLVWAYLGSLSLYVGLAVAAQLEAVRAGAAAPRSERKVEAGEPDDVAPSYGSALAAAVRERAQRDRASSNGRSHAGTGGRAT